MSITVTREITPVTIKVTREDKTITIQPIISKITSCDGFDGIVNGGTP
jgi:hypothetical protein